MLGCSTFGVFSTLCLHHQTGTSLGIRPFGSARVALVANRLFSAPINKVIQRQNRMPVKHTRARISHYDSDLLSFIRLVAMHRALGARGLAFLERAFVETGLGIVQKLRAIRAKLSFVLVLIGAIKANHCLNGFALSIHSWMFARHNE